MGQRRVINWYNTSTAGPIEDPYAAFSAFFVDFTQTATGSKIAPDLGTNNIPQKLGTMPASGKSGDGFMPGNGVGAMLWSTDTGGLGDPTVSWAYTEDFTVESINKITADLVVPDPGSGTLLDAFGFKLAIIDYVSPNQKSWYLQSPVGSYSSPATDTNQWVDAVGLPIPRNAEFKCAITYNASTNTLSLYVENVLVRSDVRVLNSSHNVVTEEFKVPIQEPTYGCKAYRVTKGVCRNSTELYIAMTAGA